MALEMVEMGVTIDPDLIAEIELAEFKQYAAKEYKIMGI